MRVFRIGGIALAVVAIIAIAMVISDESEKRVDEAVKNSSRERARQEYASIVADKVINSDIIGNLDRTSYDEDAMCIDVNGNTLRTVNPRLDGDEVDFEKVKHDDFVVTKSTKYYREETKVVIGSNGKENTTITYGKLSLEEIANQVAENVLPVNMHIWLDSGKRVKTIMTYSSLTIYNR